MHKQIADSTRKFQKIQNEMRSSFLLIKQKAFQSSTSLAEGDSQQAHSFYSLESENLYQLSGKQVYNMHKIL